MVVVVVVVCVWGRFTGSEGGSVDGCRGLGRGVFECVYMLRRLSSCSAGIFDVIIFFLLFLVILALVNPQLFQLA